VLVSDDVEATKRCRRKLEEKKFIFNCVADLSNCRSFRRIIDYIPGGTHSTSSILLPVEMVVSAAEAGRKK